MGHTPPVNRQLSTMEHMTITNYEKSPCPAACLGRKDTLSVMVSTPWPWYWPS